MYEDALKRYFNNFAGSMAHVVPFKQAISGVAVQYAWKLLNVAKGHGAKGNLVGGGNQRLTTITLQCTM